MALFKMTTLFSKFAHVLSQTGIIVSDGTMTDALAIGTYTTAPPQSRSSRCMHGNEQQFSGWRQALKRFARKSLSAACSSAASAINRSSLAFSTSPPLSREDSDFSSPPYLTFQLQTVDSDIPVPPRQISGLRPRFRSLEHAKNLPF